ncbi:MAG: NUDIX hydrolase [Sulfitobacter sp.]
MNTGDDAAFEGAKVALFLGSRLVVIQRDDFPDLSFAGYWDLPGGGREGCETPFACVQRECHEELGLMIWPENITWRRGFASAVTGDPVWFFVAHLSSEAEKRIVFGDEGQGWRLMDVADFMIHPKVIAAFQDRLGRYLCEKTRRSRQENPRCSKRGEGDEHQEDPVRRGVSPRVSLAPRIPIT